MIELTIRHLYDPAHPVLEKDPVATWIEFPNSPSIHLDTPWWPEKKREWNKDSFPSLHIIRMVLRAAGVEFTERVTYEHYPVHDDMHEDGMLDQEVVNDPLGMRDGKKEETNG